MSWIEMLNWSELPVLFIPVAIIVWSWIVING